jgi:hypothetical protein
MSSIAIPKPTLKRPGDNVTHLYQEGKRAFERSCVPKRGAVVLSCPIASIVLSGREETRSHFEIYERSSQ